MGSFVQNIKCRDCPDAFCDISDVSPRGNMNACFGLNIKEAAVYERQVETLDGILYIQS